MRLSLLAMAAAALLFSIGTAGATDTKLLAETGGFLLGNAHRCGVPGERVVRAGKIVRDIIAAAAQTPSEKESADARFVEIFLSSAYPEDDQDPLTPACGVVVTQFERLEQHHRQAGFD